MFLVAQNLGLVVYRIVFDSVQRAGSRICETMCLPLLLNVPFIPSVDQL